MNSNRIIKMLLLCSLAAIATLPARAAEPGTQKSSAPANPVRAHFNGSCDEAFSVIDKYPEYPSTAKPK